MNDHDIIITRTDRRRLERAAQLCEEIAAHVYTRRDDWNAADARKAAALIRAALMDAERDETIAAFGGSADDDGRELDAQADARTA